MTDPHIEQIAEEIAAEVRKSFQGFSLVGVQRDGEFVKVRYKWRESAAVEHDYTISLLISDSDSDESIKKEIRRQITKLV